MECSPALRLISLESQLQCRRDIGEERRDDKIIRIVSIISYNNSISNDCFMINRNILFSAMYEQIVNDQDVDTFVASISTTSRRINGGSGLENQRDPNEDHQAMKRPPSASAKEPASPSPLAAPVYVGPGS